MENEAISRNNCSNFFHCYLYHFKMIKFRFLYFFGNLYFFLLFILSSWHLFIFSLLVFIILLINRKNKRGTVHSIMADYITLQNIFSHFFNVFYITAKYIVFVILHCISVVQILCILVFFPISNCPLLFGCLIYFLTSFYDFNKRVGRGTIQFHLYQMR